MKDGRDSSRVAGANLDDGCRGRCRSTWKGETIIGKAGNMCSTSTRDRTSALFSTEGGSCEMRSRLSIAKHHDLVVD